MTLSENSKTNRKEKIGIIFFVIGIILVLTSWMMAVTSILQGPEGTYPLDYLDWNAIILILLFPALLGIAVGAKMAERVIYEFPLWGKYILLILPSIVFGSMIGLLYDTKFGLVLLVIFGIFIVLLTSIAVEVFRKKWTTKQKISYFLLGFGSIVGLIIFANWGINSGYCNLNQCDTTIEISEFTVPESVLWEERFPADFVIKNTGNEEAKNCKFSWRYPSDEVNRRIMFSNLFSLSSEKEIEIHYLSEQGVENTGWGFGLPYCYVPDLYDLKWTARVSCENASPAEVEKSILIECPDE